MLLCNQIVEIVYIFKFSKRATKQENELRFAHAAELVAEDKLIHLLLPIFLQNIEYQEEEQGRLTPMLIFSER